MAYNKFKLEPYNPLAKHGPRSPRTSGTIQYRSPCSSSVSIVIYCYVISVSVVLTYIQVQPWCNIVLCSIGILCSR